MNSYDQVLYRSSPRRQTHPDRLSTLARMFGLRTAPAERCRVMEIGCGTGANLWAMAATLPDSRFTGIDLARRPIEIGQQAVSELGLKNLELRVMDVMDIGPEFGEFDFIISHGVYSWVPDPARDKVLAVSKANLAPNGVAYVSYNAYPGCHMRRMLREMMQWHTRWISDPVEQARQGKALLEFVGDSLPEPDVYRALMKKEIESITNTGDWFLCHDVLSEDYHPVWFWQFVEHASRHGLQFLAEAEFAEMQTGIFSPETIATLNQAGGDLVAREQYSDFLKCRKFRQSLLCHAGVELERQISPGIVPEFSFSSSAVPASAEPMIRSTAPETFRADGKTSVTTSSPAGKAVLWHLGRRFPRVIPFAGLIESVREILDLGAAHDIPASALSEILLRSCAANLVQFHLHRPNLTAEPGERPEAFKVARWQLRSGNEITTLLHTKLRVDDPMTRALIELSDGQRTRPEITLELSRLAGLDPADLRPQVDQNLTRLARQALMTA